MLRSRCRSVDFPLGDTSDGVISSYKVRLNHNYSRSGIISRPGGADNDFVPVLVEDKSPVRRVQAGAVIFSLSPINKGQRGAEKTAGHSREEKEALFNGDKTLADEVQNHTTRSVFLKRFTRKFSEQRY